MHVGGLVMPRLARFDADEASYIRAWWLSGATYSQLAEWGTTSVMTIYKIVQRKDVYSFRSDEQ